MNTQDFTKWIALEKDWRQQSGQSRGALSHAVKISLREKAEKEGIAIPEHIRELSDKTPVKLDEAKVRTVEAVAAVEPERPL